MASLDKLESSSLSKFFENLPTIALQGLLIKSSSTFGFNTISGILS